MPIRVATSFSVSVARPFSRATSQAASRISARTASRRSARLSRFGLPNAIRQLSRSEVLVSRGGATRGWRLRALNLGLAGVAADRVGAHLEGLAPPAAEPALRDWCLAELRTTSPWSLPVVMAELGRFDSTGWI